MISFDDFKKIDLRVGTVLSAQLVEGSNKLVRIMVNSGEPEFPEGRQIISGIGKQYPPEQLVGRQIVIIANLEPRTFTIKSEAGPIALESQGMLLAADNGEPIILVPEKPVPAGAKIS